MSKKDLEEENEKLKNKVIYLLEENKKLLNSIGLKTIELNEAKRILTIENSRLWDRVSNFTIDLPSGKKLNINDLNLEQLGYLESIADEKINNKKI